MPGSAGCLFASVIRPDFDNQLSGSAAASEREGVKATVPRFLRDATVAASMTLEERKELFKAHGRVRVVLSNRGR